MAARSITIVGGGLAGLTLGIGLRQRDVPVTIWEAGRYPRHRVCGEFMSGKGLDVLERLGLRELLLRAPARPAETAVFCSPNEHFPIRRLHSPALCLSRHIMDQLLADCFQRSDGELKTNARWQQNSFGEGIVCANGRRVHPVDLGWRWFGLKAHAANVDLIADLEMHVFGNAYIGLCRLSDGKVNVCGLFRRRANGCDDAHTTRDLLLGPEKSLLRLRLANAAFENESLCSVAGLFLRPQRATARTDCCIGDALTMIAPVTGNGMSMAFESADLAIEPLAAFSRGDISWADAQQTIARRCDQAFSRRLAWARFLHWLMFTPLFQTALGSGLMRSEWLWQAMFTRTR